MCASTHKEDEEEFAAMMVATVPAKPWGQAFQERRDQDFANELHDRRPQAVHDFNMCLGTELEITVTCAPESKEIRDQKWEEQRLFDEAWTKAHQRGSVRL
jgi:hypothetical protein